MPHVIGVLAGKDLPPERVIEWAKSADVILAADGGANVLFGARIVPDATIGDMDSIKNSTKCGQTKIVVQDSQESTDCDKLLAYARQCGYMSITLCSVEGDQLDHVLATLHSAARSELNVRLALRTGIAWILRGANEWLFPRQQGARLSLMPLTDCEGVWLGGVRWPLQDASLNPLGANSISNVADGDVIR